MAQRVPMNFSLPQSTPPPGGRKFNYKAIPQYYVYFLTYCVLSALDVAMSS